MKRWMWIALLMSGLAHAQLAAPPTEAELQAAGAVRVKGAELAALLKNQTIEHTNLQTGQTFVMFYREDGRRFLKVGEAVRDTKWWIKDDKRCADSVAGRGTSCETVYRQGDVYRLCVEGNPACYWIATFTPGDVEKLAK